MSVLKPSRALIFIDKPYEEPPPYRVPHTAILRSTAMSKPQLGSDDIIDPREIEDSATKDPSRVLVDESGINPPHSTIPDPEEIGGSLSLSASSSSSKGKNAVIITKDEDYFMESAFMVFQVERCLFRVPSYLFSKESHIFGGMFRLPQPYPHENGDAEGSSEANPIILPDEFSKADFRYLLKALYPLSFTLHLTLTKEEWLSVLKLSTKWYFLNLRKTAISELSLKQNTSPFDPTPEPTLTSLESIAYGRKHRISAWLLSGLVDLVMRDESINDDDALDIDSDYPTTAYKLFRTRELRFRGFLDSRAAAIKEIESLFKDELSQIRSDEKAYAVPEVEIALVLEDRSEPRAGRPTKETGTKGKGRYPEDYGGKFEKEEEVKPSTSTWFEPAQDPFGGARGPQTNQAFQGKPASIFSTPPQSQRFGIPVDPGTNVSKGSRNKRG